MTTFVTKGAVATRAFVEKTGARVVVVSAKFLKQVPSLPRLMELSHARSVLIISHNGEVDLTPVASAEVLLNASLEDLSAALWRSLLIGG
jgi:phosphoserine phosphatase